LVYLNEVTELWKVGCWESKIAGAIVDNRIFVARLSRCRREENYSFVVRLTFLGTTIVVPVHLVHPVRQVYGTPNKLVQVQARRMAKKATNDFKTIVVKLCSMHLMLLSCHVSTVATLSPVVVRRSANKTRHPEFIVESRFSKFDTSQ
jgi:hypothetical protein